MFITFMSWKFFSQSQRDEGGKAAWASFTMKALSFIPTQEQPPPPPITLQVAAQKISTGPWALRLQKNLCVKLWRRNQAQIRDNISGISPSHPTQPSSISLYNSHSFFLYLLYFSHPSFLLYRSHPFFFHLTLPYP